MTRDPINTDLFYHLQEMDAEEMALESLREQDERDEETPKDRESRVRLSLLYSEAHATTVPTLPFREWRREQVRRERTSEFKGGWIHA